MKHKFLTVLLVLATVLCLALGLTACGENGGNSGNGGSSGEGSPNVEQGGEQKPDEGNQGNQGGTTNPDEGGEEKPEHTHTFINYVYNNDATCTEDGTETAICTCGASDIRTKAGTALGHKYTTENVCSGCGDAWRYTEGLQFKINTATNTFSVVGIGTAGVDVVIPYGYQGKFVTSIGEYAFSGRSELTSIELPDSVTSIGNGAFRGCSKFTSIVIPDNVTSIGDEAFYECDGLKSIAIPDSVTSIGAGAFRGCSGLTSIEIPDSVTTIGNSAFAGCYGLESVTIGNSVTSIGHSAFRRCSRLASIVIPGSVTTIGDYAFEGCSGLKSIVISNSVTSIGDAFWNCDGLENVYYMGTADEWNGINISSYNYELTKATRYYYSAEENYDGEHWYYDPETGKPVVWTKESA